MKCLIFILSILIFASCTSKKSTAKVNEPQLFVQLKSVVDTLTTEERNIVNDFLDIELASERYKNYNNIEISVIEEAGNGIRNLTVYEYAYKDWHQYSRATAEDNERLGWILDTLQIKKLKNKYSDKKDYYWKSSDIKNFKVSIMKNDSLRSIINSGKYIKLPEKIILYLTKPLIIDSNNAFISFSSGSSLLGFTEFTHFTLLMKKANGKWKIGPGYWDDVYY